MPLCKKCRARADVSPDHGLNPDDFDSGDGLDEDETCDACQFDVDRVEPDEVRFEDGVDPSDLDVEWRREHFRSSIKESIPHDECPNCGRYKYRWRWIPEGFLFGGVVYKYCEECRYRFNPNGHHIQ